MVLERCEKDVAKATDKPKPLDASKIAAYYKDNANAPRLPRIGEKENPPADEELS